MATGQVQLQHLGFLGIFKEAYKIIFSSWKDRLLPIFLTLVMPFCIVFTAEQYIASHLLKKIISYHTDLYDAWTYDSHYHELKQKIVTEWIIYVGLNTVFFLTGVVVFCLFSVSAIAYTVGCIYISFDATFKQVMRFVISRAWTRVMITFLWYFVILAIFNMIGVGVLVIGIFVITSSYQLYFFGIIVEVIILILYVSGIVYIGMIWHTASSISVLENKYYGLNALERSRSLLKGKVKALFPITLIFEAWLFGMQNLFFVYLARLSLKSQVVIGICCFFVTLKVVLVGLVVQTVCYFVCKSYHRETIDEFWIAGHE